MTGTRTAHKIQMRGGSQFKLRMLGARSVDETVLPRAGNLERIEDRDRSNVERVTFHVEERLVIGVMDEKLRRKYVGLFQDIVFHTEGAVRDNAGDVRGD